MIHNLPWLILAAIVSRPRVTRWLIDRAQRTPYRHIRSMGAFKSFVIGPMCSITRTISEPPSHRECARYAAVNCPFLARPHAKRREAGMPEDARAPAGEGIKRNPGTVCVWNTKTYRPFHAYAGNDGQLFEIGEPDSTEWYSQGRAATREEVELSVSTGIHLLEEPAMAEGPSAVAELERRKALLAVLLDKNFGARR